MSCTRRSNLAIRLYAPASTGTAPIAGSLDHTPRRSPAASTTHRDDRRQPRPHTATIAGSLDHTNYISRPGDAAAATTALSARERGLVLDRRDRRRAA